MNFPKTFADSLGRKWSIDINLSAIKRAKLLANFSFDSLIVLPTSPGKNKADNEKAGEEAIAPMVQLINDSCMFSEVLWAICKPQADQESLKQSDFDDGINGDCIHDAQMAFLQAVHDFFPKHSPKRHLVRGVAEAKHREKMLTERTSKRAEKKVAELLALMDKEMERAEQEANEIIDNVKELKKSATNSEGKSELTLTHSP